jgi:hypothetical protein
MVLAAMLISLSIGVEGTLAQGNQKHDHKARMKKDIEILLEGEVVDLHCFMKQAEKGRGPDHAKCARECIAKGLPVGLLSNDEVILLLGSQHESVADMVADFVGVRSFITGKVIEHHGLKAVEVTSIVKAQAKE